MPIYQFKCPDCGHEIEELMKRDAPNPVCDRHKFTKICPIMEKLFPTGTSFELKGNCWGKDGYKSSEKEKGSSESSES